MMTADLDALDRELAEVMGNRCRCIDGKWYLIPSFAVESEVIPKSYLTKWKPRISIVQAMMVVERLRDLGFNYDIQGFNYQIRHRVIFWENSDKVNRIKGEGTSQDSLSTAICLAASKVCRAMEGGTK